MKELNITLLDKIYRYLFIISNKLIRFLQFWTRAKRIKSSLIYKNSMFIASASKSENCGFESRQDLGFKHMKAVTTTCVHLKRNKGHAEEATIFFWKIRTRCSLHSELSVSRDLGIAEMLERHEERFFNFVLVDVQVSDGDSGFDLTHNRRDDGRSYWKEMTLKLKLYIMWNSLYKMVGIEIILQTIL